MADQVAIHLPKTAVNEGSAFTATVSFRDRATASAAIPSTVEYKIYNISEGRVVRDWTLVTAAAEVSIIVGAAHNKILRGTRQSERYELLVAADRGMATEVRGDARYVVNNVEGQEAGAVEDDVGGAVFTSMLTYPGVGDLVHVIDISDESGGPTGTPKLSPVENVVGQPGNVLLYGADPTGVEDSTVAIQAAIDSDYAVYFPPGDYLISSTIGVDKPKIIDMGGVSRVNSSSAEPGEIVRIVTTSDIHMFTITCEQVRGYGGFFDMEGVTDGTKAALYYLALCNGAGAGGNGDWGGWGGGWQDFVIRGNKDALATVDGGSDGIYVDFESSTVVGAYWTHFRFQGEIIGCNRAFYCSPENPGLSQWGNTFKLDLDVQACKQAVVNYELGWCDVRVSHQATQIFGTQADADNNPSIVCDQSACDWDCIFWDFGGGSALYANSVSWDLTGSGNRILTDQGYSIAENLNVDEAAGQGYVDRLADTNPLGDIASEVNAAGYKREGLCVFNRLTNTPLWSTGSAAGDPWVDATGTTVYTPS